MIRRSRALVCALTIAVVLVGGAQRATAAEVTTGILSGTVTSVDGHPLAGALVTIVAPSGRYQTHSDTQGRFTLVGVVPDTYVLEVEEGGYESLTQRGVLVLAAQTEHANVRLAQRLATIGSTHTSGAAFTVGSTSDTFTVSGDDAQARKPNENASGLAQYGAGTVQGAIAAVPGVTIDTFGNAIVRGGKVSDTVFDFDSVPIPQGLIAEPGGNIVGAQLSTVGVAATTVTLGGFGAESQNALAGVVDEIPLMGTYPEKQTLELGTGIGAQYDELRWQEQWATPDLRWRIAFATDLSSEYFPYGDGHTFYPSEEGTYGLALQTRGQVLNVGNVHYALTPHDDLGFLVLDGEVSYDQYDLPYAGETFGSFSYPSPGNPNAHVGFPSGLQGTYDVLKLAWTHSGAQSVARTQLYQSQYGAQAGGPFWDDLSFPDGVISLIMHQGGRENGLLYDVQNVSDERNQVDYGIAYRENNSFLYQVVDPVTEYITSNPTLFTALAYLGDTWNAAPRLDVTGTARFSRTHIDTSDGPTYNVAALDPHLGLAYRIGTRYAARATFDHTTVAPVPLETDRVDSTNLTAAGLAASDVPLAPEITDVEALTLEGRGRTQFRVTYYAEHESNRIDVLPSNFRSAILAGENPSGVGVPTNAGALLAHGAELWLKNGNVTVDANYLRGYSSSASQFAYNDLNPAAIAANALIPLSYVPDFSALLSYELRVTPRLRIAPELSYESGFPYGNGTMIYEILNGKPVLVPNDNYLNPGYNYYFLENPNLPYDATSNPYIATMGTKEGPLPNSLHSAPQTLASLHVEYDLSPRLTAMFDIVNVLGTASPSAYQSNPYLIGPPGYKGGNPYYQQAYGNALGSGNPYLLGNGVPTNDGQTQAVPWNYGTAGYVPQGYPLARTFEVKLRYRT